MAAPPSNRLQLATVPSLNWDDCRLLVESVVDYAIFMLDATGHVATWNLGAEKIKGYAPDEIIGKHFSRFYPPEDVSSGKPDRALSTASNLGRYEDEGWRLRKDGSRFWASVIITALRDESGLLRGYGKVTRDLTSKKEAEEQLRQSEQRFHHLVDAVIDYAIFMLDADGRVATWNSGARRLKGYSSEEIIGEHFSVFYTPEERASGKPDRVLEAVRQSGRFEDESWRVRKGGARFWANVVITALRDEKGNLVGFAKVTRDLTDRRKAEDAERRLLVERTAREVAEADEQRLRESEERYRALSQRLEIILEGVADGITVQESSGRIVFANSAAARLCGFDSAEELVSTPPAEVVARFDILDELGQPFRVEQLPARRIFAGEPGGSVILRVREKASGREWWSLVRASPVLGLDGKADLAINIWHDVTAERRQERQASYLAAAAGALGASLRYDEMLSSLARVLVPGLADWCAVYVLEGDELRNVAVAHVDPAKLSIAREYQKSFPPVATAQRGVWNVVRSGQSELYADISDELLVATARSPEHLQALRSVGMKAVLIAPIRGRVDVLGALSIVLAESGRTYESSDVLLAEELGRRAGAAIENVRLFEAAQAAAKAAEDASRMKDEFLATVSHELRTPLNAILGWASLLKDRVLDPAIVKPIEVIHRNAQAQVRLIDDILDVSRVITGKFRLDPKPVDLVSIAREAIEVVRPSAVAKRIDVIFAPSTDYCPLVGDPDRLQQVIWNLLSNAVRFTDAGGEVRLTIRQERSDVILSVTDTGVGIEPEFLPFVFERFKQADSSITRRVGGLGLGLALVRHIVELHGGRAAAASGGQGHGATFTITLPVRAVAPARTASPVPSRPRPSPSSTGNTSLAGVRVLVIDDEPDARDLIAAVLLQAGAVVECAPSAAEGFDALARFRPHVLVSDVGMPEEDGFSFMRRVRRLAPREGGRLPSLALTAFAREDDRTKALSAGFTTHIGKPVDPDALVSAVANLASVTQSG